VHFGMMLGVGELHLHGMREHWWVNILIHRPASTIYINQRNISISNPSPNGAISVMGRI